MQLSGQIRTTCPPTMLVGLLRDPAALVQLLPAGAKIDVKADGSMGFFMAKSVGPIRLTLPGTLTLAATGHNADQVLIAHAAHLIGGKVDLTLTLAFATEGRITQLVYTGELTATGLAGRVLKEHRERANASLKAAMTRLKLYAESQMRKSAVTAAHA